MVRAISVLLVMTLGLSACGTVRESRLNPFNWFGRSTSQAVVSEAEVNPLIPGRRSIFETPESTYQGRLVGMISELVVERRPGGAIVRVVGVADRMGPYDVRIVPLEDDTTSDILVFEMRNLQGPGARGGSDTARAVTAAVALTDQQLTGVRSIEVRGARNTRTARR